MFEWLCRKRINGLIALNKYLNGKLQEASDQIDELEAMLDDEEADHSVTNAFIDAIDNDVSAALEVIGRFPPKPAGFPDRVDVLCESAKSLHADLEKLKTEHCNLVGTNTFVVSITPYAKRIVELEEMLLKMLEAYGDIEYDTALVERARFILGPDTTNKD